MLSSYKSQWIDLLSNFTDWFLYDDLWFLFTIVYSLWKKKTESMKYFREYLEEWLEAATGGVP